MSSSGGWTILRALGTVEKNGSIRKGPVSAFSLMEVVIAVGILAAAIVAIIALLAPTLRNTREILDSTVAARLAESVDGELRRLDFASAQAVLGAPGQIVLYATVDGDRLVTHADRNETIGTPPRAIAESERYFVLFVDQLDSPPANDAVIPLGVRVEWPYQTPEGDPDDPPRSSPSRAGFSFNAVLVR